MSGCLVSPPRLEAAEMSQHKGPSRAGLSADCRMGPASLEAGSGALSAAPCSLGDRNGPCGREGFLLSLRKVPNAGNS